MQHIMKEENLHESLDLHVTAVASGIGENNTPVALACPISSKALKAWRSDECAVYIRS